MPPHPLRGPRSLATLTLGGAILSRLINEIVSDLIGCDLDQRQLALVLELVATMSTLSTGHSSRQSGGSRVESPDDRIEKRRKYDREYKRKMRSPSEKQPADLSGGLSIGQSRQMPDSFFLPLEDSRQETREEKEKKTESVVERRKKGTRLIEGMPIPDEYRQCAIDLGVSSPDKLWVEFVDYWIGIPGQRGVKLNWLATWRNRVRTVVERNGTKNQSGTGRNGRITMADIAMGRTDGY